MKSALKSFLMLTVLLNGCFLVNAMEKTATERCPFVTEKSSEGKGRLVLDTHSNVNKDGFVVVTCTNDAVLLLNAKNEAFKAVWLRDCSKHVFMHEIDASCKRALTASMDNSVRLWDLTKLPAIAIELPGHTGKITSLALKNDDHYVLTACEDGTIRLWDLSRNPVKAIIIESESKGTLKASFGPNGNVVIDFPKR